MILCNIYNTDLNVSPTVNIKLSLKEDAPIFLEIIVHVTNSLWEIELVSLQIHLYFCNKCQWWHQYSLEKLVGDRYRPFFAYDFKDASMDYPVDLYDSSDVHTQLYLLAMGITRNDCLEPCTSTFVQSSLRLFSVENI